MVLVSIPIFSINKREREIIGGIEALLKLVMDTVDNFARVVVSVGLKSGETEQIFRIVAEAETKADELHKELSLKIAEGSFFGGIREDILNLLENIDNIADSAKDAARLLNLYRIDDPTALNLFNTEDMSLFIKDLKESVVALSNLMEAFSKDKRTLLARVHTVEEFEESADSHKEALLKSLFAQAKGTGTLAVIQVRDFLYGADDIADNAEDASDVVLVLVAKGYG
jgi:predicted phosphate transport protein (TIGR00153 family)